MLCLRSALIAVVLTLIVCGTAHGEQACACDERLTEPVELFDAGAACFRLGDFDEALECFERAYALDPNPTLLYNMARSHEANDDPEAAIEAYERYLEDQPDAADRGAVLKRLEALHKQLGQAQQPPPFSPPPPVEPDPPSAIPWIGAGAGMVGIGVGVAFLVLGSSQEQDAIDEPDAFESVELASDAERSLTIGSVSLIAGGVVTLASLAWGVMDLVTLDTGEHMALGVGPAGLRWRGRF